MSSDSQPSVNYGSRGSYSAGLHGHLPTQQHTSIIKNRGGIEGQRAMGTQQLSKHMLGKLELGDQPYQGIETASALISPWVWVKYKQWEATVAAGRRKADRHQKVLYCGS